MLTRLFETRLRDLREDNGLTQAECAEIGHISKNSYIRYETDVRSLPLDIAKIYANYYHVSLDYIARLSEDKMKNKLRSC